MDEHTILLIDDDKDDRELLKDIVKSIDKGATVVDANDGFHALELITQKDFLVPDVVFLDINMPKMNGLEFLQQVKVKNLLNNVRIIVWTTSLEGHYPDECMKLGAKCCIQKPSSMSLYLETVKAILS